MRREALVGLIRQSRGPAYLANLAELFRGETTLTAVPYYVNIRP